MVRTARAVELVRREAGPVPYLGHSSHGPCCHDPIGRTTPIDPGGRTTATDTAMVKRRGRAGPICPVIIAFKDRSCVKAPPCGTIPPTGAPLRTAVSRGSYPGN